jgi:hypothetical protein
MTLNQIVKLISNLNNKIDQQEKPIRCSSSFFSLNYDGEQFVINFQNNIVYDSLESEENIQIQNVKSSMLKIIKTEIQNKMLKSQAALNVINQILKNN